MREKIENKIRRAISYAEDAGAPEIVEELRGVIELLRLRECRESMEANGMTMYCGTCCADCEKAGIKPVCRPE
ncbi:MAG: hypothetical protein PHH77_05245 [Victivallaceae bacterium]|nr:hypothetical protein [Victivallaceae bacterium]